MKIKCYVAVVESGFKWRKRETGRAAQNLNNDGRVLIDTNLSKNFMTIRLFRLSNKHIQFAVN